MRPLIILAALALGALPLGGCASTQKSDAELRGAANEAMYRHEYDRVTTLNAELVRRNPADGDALAQRAVAYIHLGRLNEASADLSRAIEASPQAPLPRLYRANILLAQGQANAAATDLRALSGLSLEPHEKVAAHTLTGTFHQMQKQYTEALASYDRAIQTARSAPDLHSQKHYRDALNNAAACHYMLGDFAVALDHMHELLAAKQRAGLPMTQDERYTLGVLSYLSGDFAEARQHFEKVSPGHRQRAAQLLNDPGFFGRS